MRHSGIHFSKWACDTLPHPLHEVPSCWNDTSILCIEDMYDTGLNQLLVMWKQYLTCSTHLRQVQYRKHKCYINNIPTILVILLFDPPFGLLWGVNESSSSLLLFTVQLLIGISCSLQSVQYTIFTLVTWLHTNSYWFPSVLASCSPCFSVWPIFSMYLMGQQQLSQDIIFAWCLNWSFVSTVLDFDADLQGVQ